MSEKHGYADSQESNLIQLAYRDFIVNISRDLMQFSGKANINITYLQEQAMSILKVQGTFSIPERKWRIGGYLMKYFATVGGLQEFFEHLNCYRNCGFKYGVLYKNDRFLIQFFLGFQININ